MLAGATGECGGPREKHVGNLYELHVEPRL